MGAIMTLAEAAPWAVATFSAMLLAGAVAIFAVEASAYEEPGPGDNWTWL